MVGLFPPGLKDFFIMFKLKCLPTCFIKAAFSSHQRAYRVTVHTLPPRCARGRAGPARAVKLNIVESECEPIHKPAGVCVVLRLSDVIRLFKGR